MAKYAYLTERIEFSLRNRVENIRTCLQRLRADWAQLTTAEYISMWTGHEEGLGTSSPGMLCLTVLYVGEVVEASPRVLYSSHSAG
jgi:hypothetical protein